MRDGRMLRLRSGLCLLVIAVAVSGWLLAGCGESRQDALNKLAAATRDARATSDVIDERVAAGVYGYLPCFEMQLKAAALLRQSKRVASNVRYFGEPPAEVDAQKALDHASDLHDALPKCLADEAAKRAVAEQMAALGQKAARLGDAFNDYLKKASSPAEQAAKSDVEADEAEFK
jgi:hypothetical protein